LFNALRFFVLHNFAVIASDFMNISSPELLGLKERSNAARQKD
jgi:hypothetical protein